MIWLISAQSHHLLLMGGLSYVVIGNDDYSRALADELGVPHIDYVCDHYPHEDLFQLLGVKYGDLEGKYAILVTRFDQPFADENREKLSHKVLGMLAFVYDLFESHGIEKCDSLQPCMVANKQDHIPRYDPDPNVRKNDSGKIPLLTFLMEKLYPAKIVTYHGHNPDLRCGDGETELFGYEIASLCLVDPIAERLLEYDELSDPEDVCVVCPDKKRKEFSEIFAEAIGTPHFETLEVTRTGPSHSEAEGRIDAKGRHAVMIDDTAHTLSATKATVESIDNLASMTMVNIHSPVTVKGWERLQEVFKLEEELGIPVRYLTTETVRLSDEFRNHPNIDVIPLSDIVSVAAEYYRNKSSEDES